MIWHSVADFVCMDIHIPTPTYTKFGQYDSVPLGAFVSVSPSGQWMAVFHGNKSSVPAGDSVPGKVELWSQDGFVRTLAPDGGGQEPCHGAIYPATHMFGCIE